MCTQKPPHDYSEQLYNRYRDVFCVYINESVRLGGSYAAFALAFPASTFGWATVCLANAV